MNKIIIISSYKYCVHWYGNMSLSQLSGYKESLELLQECSAKYWLVVSELVVTWLKYG